MTTGKHYWNAFTPLSEQCLEVIDERTNKFRGSVYRVSRYWEWYACERADTRVVIQNGIAASKEEARRMVEAIIALED